MDADRIATIVERLDRNQRVWGPDIAWLVDALETAQAENQRLEGVMECMIAGGQDYQALEAERDAVQAENTRLQQLLTDFANTGDARIESLEDQVDRLTNQITDLQAALDTIAKRCGCPMFTDATAHPGFCVNCGAGPSDSDWNENCWVGGLLLGQRVHPVSPTWRLSSRQVPPTVGLGKPFRH